MKHWRGQYFLSPILFIWLLHWDCEYWEKHGNKVTIWWGISSFCFAVSSTFAFHSTSAVTSSAATCSVPLADHLSPSCDHHSLTQPLALVRSGVLEDDHKHNCMSKSISTLHFNRLAEQTSPHEAWPARLRFTHLLLLPFLQLSRPV